MVPSALVLSVGFFLPLGWLVYISLHESLGFGEMGNAITVGEYTQVVSNGLYRDSILHTLKLGALAGTISLVLSFPVAYFISFKVTRHRNLLLMLVVCSLLGSYLVRVYAWRSILSADGVINSALEGIGIIDKPISGLIFNDFAVLLTWTNVFIPLVVLLLTAAMGDIDTLLLEAARDLGATPARAVVRVVIPITMPAIVASFTYVLVLVSGDYATPVLMGGKGGLTVAQVISDQFVAIGNRPAGAALSVAMLVVVGVIYVILSQLRRLKFTWA